MKNWIGPLLATASFLWALVSLDVVTQMHAHVGIPPFGTILDIHPFLASALWAFVPLGFIFGLCATFLLLRMGLYYQIWSWVGICTMAMSCGGLLSCLRVDLAYLSFFCGQFMVSLGIIAACWRVGPTRPPLPWRMPTEWKNHRVADSMNRIMRTKRSAIVVLGSAIGVSNAVGAGAFLCKWEVSGPIVVCAGFVSFALGYFWAWVLYIIWARWIQRKGVAGGTDDSAERAL